MLETINMTAPKVTKAEYNPRYDALVKRLIILQQEARTKGIGVVVLFEGWKGAGKGSRISDLIYNLDARYTSVHVTEDFGEQEAKRVSDPDFGSTGFYPHMQQFWQALGNRGTMTFYDRGWYSIVAEHLYNHARWSADKKKKVKKRNRAFLQQTLDSAVESIDAFESQLTNDGYLVIKFFMHISEETQKKRLTNLYDDPSTRWRVDKEDMEQLDHYKEMYHIYDELVERSNFCDSSWILLDAEDRRRVNLSVIQTIVSRLEQALSAQEDEATKEAEAKAAQNSAAQGTQTVQSDERNRSAEQNAELLAEAHRQAEEASAYAPAASKFHVLADYPRLENVDHDLKVDRAFYKKELKAEQARLRRLEQEMYIKRIPLIIMYEGLDAAGKGGNIKRVAQALDARSYTIFPSPAPTKQELMHPFLWRYWTRLPKAGHVGIYDRSWYGRVLVERVEGFASPQQWSRAYDEINEFERDLVRWGAILIKFWVDISPETQLQRFEAREQNPEKQWKITAEDWRNRDKYPQYYAAIDDMFRLTSTDFAPWIVLESDDKYYARIKALKIINEALEERLENV